MNHGSQATRPTDDPADKTGYHFTNWFKQGESSAYDFSTPIEGDTTIVAQYEINTYTVTFTSESGTYETQQVNHGSQATRPTDDPADKTGYHFTNWFKQGESSAYDFTSPIEGDTTIVAQYTINHYTVTFDLNYSGAPTPQTISVDWNTAIGAKAPNDPSRTGFVFNGWYDASTGGTKADPIADEVITSATTYYAHWLADVSSATVSPLSMSLV